MVLRCFVCKITYDKNKKDIQMHKVPEKEHIKKLWLSALNIKQISPNARVCSKHFNEQDFTKSIVGERKYIKSDAVPSINLQKNGETTDRSNSESIEESIESTQYCNKKHTCLKRSLAMKQATEDEVVLRKNIRTFRDIDVKQISQSPFEAETCLEALIEELHEKRKEIKRFRDKVRKLQKTVKDLRSLMKTLKDNNLITSTARDILQSTESLALVALVQKVLSHKHKFNAFPPELKTFAATLHFYSPKAYDFVRRSFINILPHPFTIRKWYYSIDGSPGISQPALDCLTKKAREAIEKNHTILCGLQIDDTSIKKQIDFNGKEYIGFINFGTKLDSDELPLAKEVVVIMAVAINEHWKIPVAYYFIDALTARDRANIITNVLKSIHETGIDIISLTFDDPQYNFTMANILGAQLQVDKELQVFFLHPITKKRIYIILDACHMIKLVGNCFAEYKVLQNKNNKEIRYDFVQKLIRIQEKYGLHVNTKVRLRHLNWYNEKMKVCLAVQVLSSSVSKGMQYLRESIKLPEFANSKATEKFCLMFNDIFDVLNSRNKFCITPSRQPITTKNLTEITQKINCFIDYISSLKYQGVSILHSKRKTGFFGLIITLNSIVGIFKNWIQENSNMSYFLTYKLSQDHLELFFSAVRNHCGHNNNPTCTQFMAVFKKLLTHAQVSGSKYANSVALDDTIFLNITSTNIHKDNIDNICITEENDINILNNNINYDHSYNIHALFEVINKDYINNVLGYIAGFIVRKISKDLSCNVCLTLLHSDTTFSKLQHLKSRGGLINVSADV